MANILVKFLIFAISSLSILALIYYQVKIIHLQQIILFLIVILIITLRTLRHSIGKKLTTGWLLMFIVTFFVQLLVAATGAVFSPFFVLIHLHVIGLSLFFDFWTAFLFLVMELAVLFLNIRLDQNLLNLVSQDFGSVLLYFSSIVVITPISKFISQQYHIKSDSLKILFKELSVQESIIEQIDDFVITTDKYLIVLSVNDAAKKIVDLTKENSIITDTVNLVDEKDKRLTQETLLQSLSPLTQNQSKDANQMNLIIKGYSLKIPNKKILLKVIIRVSPVLNPDGKLEKFIFLIGQASDKEGRDTAADRLQEAHRKYISIINILKEDPTISKLTTINLYLDILKKYEKDILIASEFSLYPASLKIGLADTLGIIIQIQKKYQQLAQNLGIDYQVNLPDNLKEEYNLAVNNANLPEHLAQTSSLTVTTDPKLLQILLETIIEITTSIAYGDKTSLLLHGQDSLVEFDLSPLDDCIKITVKTKVYPKPQERIQELLSLNNKTINNNKLETIDNLVLISSLESYIMENIINLLGLSFTVEYNQYSNILSFNISVNKYFNRTR